MTQPIRRVLIQEKLANGKGLLRGLTLAAFAVLGTMTCVASVGAATKIDRCQPLNTPGATYVLTRDLSSCESCLVVNADRITIDLGIYAISGGFGDCAGSAGITDGGTAWQGTTVKNGTIMGFTIGVDLGSSTRNQILNLRSSANSVDGIVVGERSLVKGSLIEGNGQDGIAIRGSFGQVQDCTIGGSGALEGNARFGIWGGSHQLITRNTVVGNKTGIVVGFFSTVSFNTSSYNTVFGVSALDHSLITGNTTIGNGPLAGIATGGPSSVSDDISNGNGDGGTDINVQCPSTVTNNQASGHMNSYDFNGPPSRCQTKNNK